MRSLFRMLSQPYCALSRVTSATSQVRRERRINPRSPRTCSSAPHLVLRNLPAAPMQDLEEPGTSNGDICDWGDHDDLPHSEREVKNPAHSSPHWASPNALAWELQDILCHGYVADGRVVEPMGDTPDLDLVISGFCGEGAAGRVFQGFLWVNRANRTGPLSIAIGPSDPTEFSVADSKTDPADQNAYAIPVAVKVSCPENHPDESDREALFIDDLHDRLSRQDVISVIESELAVYRAAKDHRTLDVLSPVYGALRIYKNSRTYTVQVMGLCGPPVRNPASLPLSDK